MTYLAPSSAPAYIDKAGPTISAAEMNWLDQKAREFVSIADYGTLQAALAVCPCVYIPYGTWTFALGTTLPNNADIWGPGTLKAESTSGLSATIHYALSATNASDWRISVRQFDGNVSGMSGAAGFKVRGILVRGGTDYEFTPSIWSNWHDGVIEVTSATQSNPINAYTPPTDVADTIKRGLIGHAVVTNCGRAVDDGPGYSDSKVVQLGSTTRGHIVTNIIAYNCPGSIVAAAAYNFDFSITDIHAWNDNPSDARTYASAVVTVEQLSQNFTVGNITGRGFKQLMNIESPLGGSIGDFWGDDVYQGVSLFSSNIGATNTDLARISVADGSVRCRDTSSGSFGFRITNTGNSTYDVTIGTIQTENGEFGIQISGVTRGSAGVLTAKAGKTGIAVTGNTDFLVAAWNAVGCTNEGLYCGAGNNRVTIQGGRSSGNGTYGLDVAVGQTDLRIYDNDLNGLNSTADFRIQTYSGNNVRHRRNKYATSSGTIKTITGDTPSLQFVGPLSYITQGGATNVTNFTNAEVGEPYMIQARDANSTLKNGTNIFTNTGADIAPIANNRGLTLVLNDAGKWVQVG